MGQVVHHSQASTLADVLDRVLDKGVVVAGDVAISLVGVELLTIRLRLLVSSVDKAKEMGISWWETDPFLNSKAKSLELEKLELLERVERLEAELRLKDAGGEVLKPRDLSHITGALRTDEADPPA
ncbi:MAG: gas vesicle protein [Pseudomonadota bacterium]